MLIALLTEIRDLLKVAPRARAAMASAPKEPALAAPDEPWARFEWPVFTDPKCKRRAKTLGESVANEWGRKDIGYWAERYEVRRKTAENVAFRKMLTDAANWLANMEAAIANLEPNEQAPPVPARKPERTDAQLTNQDHPQRGEDVPF